MLQPDQFAVNEAWIAFKLNDAPLRTLADGDFDVFALMDAATRRILSSAAVSIGAAGPLEERLARQLFDDAYGQTQATPATLFLPDDLDSSGLADAARSRSITVVEIPLDQLLGFIGAARQSFRERFGSTPQR